MDNLTFINYGALHDIGAARSFITKFWKNIDFSVYFCISNKRYLVLWDLPWKARCCILSFKLGYWIYSWCLLRRLYLFFKSGFNFKLLFGGVQRFEFFEGIKTFPFTMLKFKKLCDSENSYF